jgi:hypothetical protein
VWVLLGSVLSLCSLPAPAQTPAGQHSDYDPRALQLLNDMADAYAHLEALDQESVFSSSITPLPPPGVKPTEAEMAKLKAAEEDDSAGLDSQGGAVMPGTGKRPSERRLRLLIERPNRLLLESQQSNSATGKMQWVSDGKTFWTYNQSRNAYTRENAPAHLHDFLKLSNLNSGSLELLMVLGLNPFTDLQSKVDSFQYAGTAVVRGVPTEVVMLKMASKIEATESRFYIGKDDHLLYRMVTETAPVLTVLPSGKVGDPLDELLDDNPPPSAPSASDPSKPSDPDDPNADSGSVPMVKRRIAYDNLIATHPEFGPQTFAFQIPPSALLYQPIDLHGSRKMTPKEYLKEWIKKIKSQKQHPAPPQAVQ